MVNLIVKSNLKKVVKELRISINLAQALNKKVELLLLKAVERAKANHRTTVLPQDL